MLGLYLDPRKALASPCSQLPVHDVLTCNVAGFCIKLAHPHSYIRSFQTRGFLLKFIDQLYKLNTNFHSVEHSTWLYASS